MNGYLEMPLKETSLLQQHLVLQEMSHARFEAVHYCIKEALSLYMSLE